MSGEGQGEQGPPAGDGSPPLRIPAGGGAPASGANGWGCGRWGRGGKT